MRAHALNAVVIRMAGNKFLHLKNLQPHINCAWMDMQIAQIVMTGKWDDEDATEVLQLGMGACSQIDAYMRQCLRDALSADSIE